MALKGSKSYKLFDAGPSSWYINLKHFPQGVIEYWFSFSSRQGSAQSMTYALPQRAVSDYKAYEPLRVAEQRIYAAIKNVDASTVFLVTTGVVVAGVVTGITIAVEGPSIAAWVASAAPNVRIAIASAGAGASQVIYQAGQKIQEVIKSAPQIEQLILMPAR